MLSPPPTLKIIQDKSENGSQLDLESVSGNLSVSDCWPEVFATCRLQVQVVGKKLVFWFGHCDHLLASSRVELVATTVEAVKKSSLGYSSEDGFYDLYLLRGRGK
jgi:hypothetical protein